MLALRRDAFSFSWEYFLFFGLYSFYWGYLLAINGLIKKISKTETLNTEYSLTEFGKSTVPIVKSLIKWGTFNKKKITKVINNDVALSESFFLQVRVIDLFHDEIRLKNLQRKKQI